MTDLLTPDELRKELSAANAGADREVDPYMRRAYLRLAHICRDYLTLWDRNKELEKQVQTLNAQSRITGRGERYL